MTCFYMKRNAGLKWLKMNIKRSAEVQKRLLRVLYTISLHPLSSGKVISTLNEKLKFVSAIFHIFTK